MVDPKELAAGLRASASAGVISIDQGRLLHEAADALERLSAPVEGMETTSEDIAKFVVAEPNYDGMKYFLWVDEQRRLVRDFARLQAEVARLRALLLTPKEIKHDVG